MEEQHRVRWTACYDQSEGTDAKGMFGDIGTLHVMLASGYGLFQQRVTDMVAPRDVQPHSLP